MNLKEFFEISKNQSDKGSTHDYINGYYDTVFSPLKNEKIELLEIGVHGGWSMELWSQFFTNGNIIGLDIESYQYVPTLKNVKIKICDAYSDVIVSEFENNRFDFIIDDGPHTLQSQILTIQKYLPKLKIGGKLIIEDIQSIHDLNNLIIECDNTGMPWQVFDLRQNKGRYDDIIIEITKTK
jgi:23S rRNA U2552 (ribose-2'-O)-methylase RlmE/FtsJ